MTNSNEGHTAMWRLTLLILLGILASTAVASDYVAFCRVKTSVPPSPPATPKAGCDLPVKRVRVNVMEQGLIMDQYLTGVYTTTGGVFSAPFEYTLGAPDVYITVMYLFQAPDEHLVVVRDENSTETLVETKVGGVWYSLSEGVSNLGTLNLASNKANIG